MPRAVARRSRTSPRTDAPAARRRTRPAGEGGPEGHAKGGGRRNDAQKDGWKERDTQENGWPH